MGVNVSRKKRKGFTLIEIVVAMALLAIIILPILKNFVTSARVNYRGRKIMIATDVAQTIMEGFSGKSYQQVINGMDKLMAGFDMSVSADAAVAFSSINDNFYNEGTVDGIGHAQKVSIPDLLIVDAAPTKITFGSAVQACTEIPPLPSPDIWTVSSDSATISMIKDEPVPIDRIVSAVVMTAGDSTIPYLRTNIASDPPLAPYMDTTTPSSDKRIYFGYTSDRAPGATSRQHIPYFAFMIYTRVQKEQYFFDVICTFLPMAEADDDTYYTYKVRVAVYDYTYEMADDGMGGSSVTCVDRFDDSFFASYGTVYGDPLVVLEGGIMSKHQSDTL